MSLILDALKKSEADRERSQAPTLNTRHEPRPLRRRKSQKNNMIYIALFGVIILAGGIGLAALPNLLEDAGIEISDGTQPPKTVARAPHTESSAPTERPAPSPAPVTATEPESPSGNKAQKPVVLETFRMGRLSKDQVPAPQRHSREDLEDRSLSPEEAERLEALHKVEQVPDMRPTSQATAGIPRSAPTTAKVTAPPVAKLPALDTAEDHLKRGWTSLQKGLFNQAIADFNRALTLEPGYADVYFARAWALEKKGLFNDAIADYGQHLRIKPGNADARFSRGVLYTYKGDFHKAGDDFVQAYRWADSDLRPYVALWLYVTRERAGINGMAEFEQNILGLNIDRWPGVIIDLFLGAAIPDEVIVAAKSVGRAEEASRLCVGEYFIGQYHLLSGNEAKAITHFKAARATAATDYRQYHAAIKELERLGVR